METPLSCTLCSAVCKPDDRFCSQCGSRNPAGVGDAEQMTRVPAVAPTASPAAALAAANVSVAPVFGRRYRIERMLGAGAMGNVYQAIDLSVDERVALKVLSENLATEAGAIERFKTELKLARRIRHRNVVQSFDIGFAEERWYISMEYVDGENLSAYLQRKGRLAENEALEIVRQVLRGLKAAHDLGIVHRDIKAENILVNKDGMAFITDFGVAAISGKSIDEIVGTPVYMAPEQFLREPPSSKTDLYSCGVLLYFLLSGGFPFQIEVMETLISSHLYNLPGRIAVEFGISDETWAVVAGLLEKRAADRPRDAAAVVEAIDRILNKEVPIIETDRPIALVVDENEEDGASLQDILEEKGFHVLRGRDARSGIDLAFGSDPALVVLHSDIPGGLDLAVADDPEMLPITMRISGANGLGFCRVLHADERLSAVPLVVTTAFNNPSVRVAFDLMGVSSVVLKPVSPDELARVCAEALRGRGFTQQGA